MEYALNLEYDFNHTYYYNKMVSTPTTIKCLYCENGEHKRIGDGIVVQCPVCNGNGEIESGGSLKEEPRKCILSYVTSEIGRNGDRSKYHFTDGSDNVIGTVYHDINKCIDGKLKGLMGYSSK